MNLRLEVVHQFLLVGGELEILQPFERGQVILIFGLRNQTLRLVDEALGLLGCRVGLLGRDVNGLVARLIHVGGGSLRGLRHVSDRS